MNETIETILRHRSIRKFKNEKLTEEQIKYLVRSAQAASTSSYVQAYSIIGVTDQEKKNKIAEVARNQFNVVQNGHFFVFCADFYRHEKVAEWKNKDVIESIESTEKFMVAVIDAALAAQNTAIAAESMGLGICYIGGIRNNLHVIQDILETPYRVIPLFGLAVGVPDQAPEQKPRLPFEHIYHENRYEDDTTEIKKQLDEYDRITEKYYAERSEGNRRDRWTDQITQMLEGKRRMYMKEYVAKKGFNLR